MLDDAFAAYRSSADGDLPFIVRLLEQADGLFNALGRRSEGRCHIGFHRLRAIRSGGARVLQGGELGLNPVHPLALLRHLVDDDKRRHDGEPYVPDFPESAAQICNALIEIMGQSRQMMLLASSIRRIASRLLLSSSRVRARAASSSDASRDRSTLKT